MDWLGGYSTRNVNRPGIDLSDAAGEAVSRRPAGAAKLFSTSPVTFWASIHTIKQLRPPSFTLENVGGCPTPEVMDVLHRHLPGYECAAFRLNAADFGSLTWRYRLHMIAVLRKSLVVADTSCWLAFLEQCRVPRQVATEEGLQACLLDCASPEVKACVSVVRLPPPSPATPPRGPRHHPISYHHLLPSPI